MKYDLSAERVAYQNWAAARKEEVLQYARAQIEHFAASKKQADLLLKAVEAYPFFRSHDGGPHPYIEVPFLVYQAITGSHSGGVPVAAVSFMIRVASKLYDDFMDGDLGEEWKECATPEILDAVIALSTLVPPLLLTELDIPTQTRLEMQQMLFQGVLDMLAGQAQDLANKNQVLVSVRDVELSIAGKSGAGIAMSAGLAAKMTGCSPDDSRAYMDFARALGILNLVVKDIYEMFKDPECRDLVQGTRTLQIACAMEQMSDSERTAFVSLLEQARTSESARNQVRRELRKIRYYYPCLEIVIRYKTQAKEFLGRTNPKEPARTFLHVLLNSQSIAI